MRKIYAIDIKHAVKKMCIETNVYLPEDVKQSIDSALDSEPWARAKETLNIIISNTKCASDNFIPICQDTGAACIFVELGCDVHIDGDFELAINEGVREGYLEGYLRKSIVGDPLRRVNTNDNTPAFITTHLVPGDKCTITLMPKGAGSENMSALKMLSPADGVEGVMDFIISTVKNAGANACPPMIVGVGIGGTFDKVAYLSKKALLRPLNVRNSDPYYEDLENSLLQKINDLGIGPQGYGGKTTCLGVNIETMPTHVAMLPVAVNISCHVTRRASITL